MKNLQKFGALAAFYQAAAYIVGIIYFLLIVNYAEVTDPMEKVVLLINNQNGIYSINFLIYIVFGFLLIGLVLSLNEQLREKSPGLMKVTTMVGLIWAGLVIASGMIYTSGISITANLFAQNPDQAAMFWATIESVSLGVGGGSGEVPGGLWVLLISIAALRVRVFPKAVHFLGILVGVVGLLSAVPGLTMLTGVFGITQIIWFVWIGVSLLTVKNKS